MSTAEFTSRFMKRFAIANSVILDFGCGPGFLADSLSGQNVELTGVDINDYFIALCKENHPNFSFHTIPIEISDQLNWFDHTYRDKKFDWIVVLSISQYYSAKEEFFQLLTTLKPYLKTGGSILVADVITNATSSWIDLMTVLRQSLKSGNLLNAFRFISYLIFSNYRKVSLEKPLLQFETEDFLQYANQAGLKCTMHKDLTLHTTRSSYQLSL